MAARLFPGAVSHCPEDQPVADPRSRSRLTRRCSTSPPAGAALWPFFDALSLENYTLLGSVTPALSALLSEKHRDRGFRDAYFARRRLSDRLRLIARTAAALARGAGPACGLAVLDLAAHPASIREMNILPARGPAQLDLLMALAIVKQPPAWLAKPTPPSISASSIPICRSWCCRSTRRLRSSMSRCSRRPPISAARAGRFFGW